MTVRDFGITVIAFAGGILVVLGILVFVATAVEIVS